VRTASRNDTAHPAGSEAMVMGDLVLTDTELSPVVKRLLGDGFRETLHARGPLAEQDAASLSRNSDPYDGLAGRDEQLDIRAVGAGVNSVRRVQRARQCTQH